MSTGKEILELCKSPFPLEDQWIKKQCKKYCKDKRLALITYVFVREQIRMMNEVKMYNLIPDTAKRDMVRVITNQLIHSELINKAWEKV